MRIFRKGRGKGIKGLVCRKFREACLWSWIFEKGGTGKKLESRVAVFKGREKGIERVWGTGGLVGCLRPCILQENR